MMTICVVGSGGFVGGHLVTALRSLGHRVLGLSSSDGSGIDPQTGLLPAHFAFAEPVDAVVYAAQSPHYRNTPALAWHLQAVSTVAPVQAAVAAMKAGAKRFVFLSTGNVYQPSFEPLSEQSLASSTQWYPLSKLHGEQALALLRPSLSVHVLRIFGVYGPGQQEKLVANLATSIAQGKPIALAPRQINQPDGGLRINPCHVSDAVQVIVRLLQQGGPDLLNVAGPDVASVRDMATQLADAIGRPVIWQAAERPRGFDLVADTRCLESVCPWPFVRLAHGLREVALALDAVPHRSTTPA